MNRHFVYSAMTDTVLGTPIRREESKSRETPWVPTDTPGYVRRINAEGMPEVSHVDNLPKPAPELPVITILAPSDEWEDGAPPERGWYEASEGQFCNLCSHWDGSLWSPSVGRSVDGSINVGDPSSEIRRRRPLAESLNVQWRGPRLTGDRWPEAL